MFRYHAFHMRKLEVAMHIHKTRGQYAFIIHRIMNDAGVLCICAFVAPHDAVRQRARDVVGGDRFVEIYLSAPVDVCRQRDKTGAYALADAGKIAQFPGVTATYEPPRQPDLTLPTHEITVEESVTRLLALLKERNFIP